MKKMTDSVEKFKKVGGPLPKSILDQYPGDDQFIQYI